MTVEVTIEVGVQEGEERSEFSGTYTGFNIRDEPAIISHSEVS
jgi:hypothetical protein